MSKSNISPIFNQVFNITSSSQIPIPNSFLTPMSAEIICVGTEMLLGDILNSNAQYLAQQLAQLGIPHYYQTVVGDNPDRLKEVIEIAASRVQILILPVV